MLTTQWRDWTLALLLLLIAGGLPSQLHADSPSWADEQMLVRWPDALGSTVPTDYGTPETIVAGHSVISDGHLQTTSSVDGLPQEDSELVPAYINDAPIKEQRLPPLQANSGCCQRCESWQILPAGILYKSYIAGEKEPRMAAALLSERDRGSVFEATIGGRLGFVRYGTHGPVDPQGFQWDLEGAAMLRQDIEQELDVEAVDFRVGSVLTWRRGRNAVKAGYYHLSSHLGDEFLIRNPGYPRLNYVRDALLVGIRHHLRPDLQIYGEVSYSVNTDGGAEPLELQFGFEYTPIEVGNRTNAPVLAVNGHSRQEFDFGGSVNVIAGWEWRGRHNNRRLRIGGQYYNGKEIQWSFYDESVAFTGIGIWYDF